ncbi:Uncharacterised protein [Citrobacter freundii]|nr:Uncharacterised protein [Citrobacter freundii]
MICKLTLIPVISLEILSQQEIFIIYSLISSIGIMIIHYHWDSAISGYLIMKKPNYALLVARHW